jgi:hypothetical protein
MRRPALRRSNNGQGRERTTIPFSTEALRANLLGLQNVWEMVQASRDRAAIYGYLAAVFETVMVWAKEGKAVKRAYRALHVRGHKSVREPFAALILCTADHWVRARALQYAGQFKDLDQPLGDFMKARGGINACAERYARRLGRYRPLC